MIGKTVMRLLPKKLSPHFLKGSLLQSFAWSGIVLSEVARPKAACRTIFSFFILFLFAFPSQADSFKVYHADTEQIDNVYKLSANLDYQFNDEVKEAIKSGVPLVLVLDIEIYRPRDYIWNKKIASLEQKYKLQFHALSEQYIVTNLNSGARLSYPSFYSATASISSISGLPVIDAHLLEQSVPYLGRMRASIELSALPGPLRLSALFSSKWSLDSEWYEWTLIRIDNE